MIRSLSFRIVSKEHLDKNRHANNIRGFGVFFEDARAELLEGSGLGPEALRKKGLALHVSESSYKFRASLYAGDDVYIESSFWYERGLRVYSEQKIERKGREVATATSTYAFVDAETGRPIKKRLPAELVERLKK